MLHVIMPNVITESDIMLNVIIVSAIILNIVMLSVAFPYSYADCQLKNALAYTTPVLTAPRKKASKCRGKFKLLIN